MAQTSDTSSKRSAEKFVALFLFNLGGPRSPLEPSALQSQSAGAGGWTPTCTSGLSHLGHGRRLDLPVLNLREAHGNLPLGIRGRHRGDSRGFIRSRCRLQAIASRMGP